MRKTKNINAKLEELLSQNYENEIVEFKEANNGFDSNKLGKYFSALCNEANLMGHFSAWLVFGVRDKDKKIINTQFRSKKSDLHNLKAEVANGTTNRISFIEIYEINTTDGRVVLFEIPAAPKGIPIAWKGHYYGRDGEELNTLNTEEFERIRAQATEKDWSAEIIHSASIEDLSQIAIHKARESYKKKNPKLSEDIDSWNDFTFLNKAKVCIKGKITVIENDEGNLIFSNAGRFIPESIEEVVIADAPEFRYRNKFLADAMVNLNMIDTIGSGIKKMFLIQRKKYFPLPDYEFTNNKVKVTITGKVIDINYAHKLATLPDLRLEDIILLDKVVKNKSLNAVEIKHLKSKGLIEGRRPNFYISAYLAKVTGEQGDYMKQRGIDDEYCKKMILDYLEKFGKGKSSDFERIILEKLPDVLNEYQKKNKIKNLLQKLKNEDKIFTNGKFWEISI